MPGPLHKYRFHLACLGLVAVLAGEAAAAQAVPAVADTLNRLDGQGQRQGWWQVIAPNPDKPEYAAGKLIEEGRYTDNKRMGLWKRYWPNGNVRSQVHYASGQPRGEYAFYYADGKPEEQGSWDLNRNTGSFKRWHGNGNIAQEFVFDAYGTRDGVQKYYHPNGRLAVEVTIENGREEGMMKRYYPNGELQETAIFHAGEFDPSSFKSYRPKTPVPAIGPSPDAKAAPARSAGEATNATVFAADGWNALYDAQHRLSQQGVFRDGRLWNGKLYQYDRNGILYRIEFYSEGRYVGNVPLGEDDR